MSFQDLIDSVNRAADKLNPAFTSSSPHPLAPELLSARNDLLSTINSLQLLLVPPTEALLHHTNLPIYSLVSLRWLAHFDIFTAVPSSGSISYVDLAQARHVPIDTLTRIIRYATTSGWFSEPTPSSVQHSPLSLYVATSEIARGQLRYQLEINFKASFHLIEATESSIATQSRPDTALKTAFNLAFSTPLNSATWASSSPVWSQTYSLLMQGFQNNPAFHISHIVTNYDFASLGPGPLLDLGGNTGSLAIALANANPDLKVVVQDLPLPVAQGQAALPEGLEGRVTFQPQDFLQENVARGMAGAVLRFILHDWPDDDAVRILQGIKPALVRGAKVVVFDVVNQGEGGDWLKRRVGRNMDVLMMCMFGARERGEEEWDALVRRAGYRVDEIRELTGCAASLIILRLDDEG
ncbi:O-methyltransferase domain-containing protein 11 [Elsinoe fawcettii]|nr:O-methyltransferase domain-containing protein 11 [Elsinoe fawcettii]